MRNRIKNSNFLRGAVLTLIVFSIIASPFSFFTKGIAISSNVAYAATAQSVCNGYAVGVTTSILTKNSDGTYSCQITLGDTPGPEYTLNADGSTAGSTVTIGNTTQTYTAAGKPITQTTDCSSLLTSMANPFSCMFRSLVSYTAATLIWIARWILVFSAAVFNWLVDNTIVHFGAVYTSTVQTAVQNAWTAFRDVANILIIGIFTFIAISIILGLKEFGQKKLIANVLIVAVLINFSLLFTEIVIDASNFTASQIYNAAALGTVGSAGASSGTVAVTTANVTGANAGIGGQFIYLLGVQSFGDTKTALDNIAKAQDNGWIALFHGLFVFVILVAVAIVLFYGSFLLVARVILIIFLMVTASVAVASYLVPKWQSSRYGFDTWKSSLIRSAVLAPILMFFLWMTLTVSWAIHGTQGSGSFGDMVANPTQVSDITTFFNYALILGLLFVTFKLSSIFASKIAGFNFAAMVPGAGLGIAGAFTGLLGSNTLGFGARALRGVAKDNNWANQGIVKRSAARVANTLATTSYNPLKQPTVAKVAKSFGVPGTLVGKGAIGASSFEDQMKAKAKHADELARQIGPSDAAKDKTEAEGRERFKEQKRQQDKLIREQADTKEQLVSAFKQGQTARPQTETSLKNAQAEKTDAENRKRTIEERQASEIRVAEAREASGQAQPSETAAIRARHRTEMEEGQARINAAQKEITAHNQTLEQLNREADAHAENSEEFKKLGATLKQTEDNLKSLGKDENAAGAKAKTDADLALRRSLLWDKRAAGDLKGAMQNHDRDESLKRIANMLPKEGGGHAPAAASAGAPKPAPAGGGDAHGGGGH